MLRSSIIMLGFLVSLLAASSVTAQSKEETRKFIYEKLKLNGSDGYREFAGGRGEYRESMLISDHYDSMGLTMRTTQSWYQRDNDRGPYASESYEVALKDLNPNEVEVSKDSVGRYLITLQCKDNEKKIKCKDRIGKKSITNRLSFYAKDEKCASQLAKAFTHLIGLCIASSATGELFEP